MAERAAGGEHRALSGVPRGAVVRLALALGRLAREREVETRAVGVRVALVRGRDHRVLDRANRRGRLLVHGGQRAPRRRDLHRVDDEAAADQRFERRHVVAVLHPVLDERDVERVAGRALLVDDATGRLDDVRVAFVEHEQHVRVAGLVVAVGLDRVVEAQHGGRRAALDDPPHRVEAVGERRERERGADLGRRQRMERGGGRRR